MTLEDLGWNPRFAAHFAEYETNGLLPARISFEARAGYRAVDTDGEMPAVLPGRILHAADGRESLPVVGDWVAADILHENTRKAVIRAILPRASVFTRKEAGGRTVGQPIAANVDTVFLTVGLDHNFNLRRIERYLTLVWESGSMPVVLLTKADLCEDTASAVRAVEEIAPGVPVHALSTVEEQGLGQLDSYIRKGHTIALLGSSGVGKSTLINYLLGGGVQKVKDVRVGDSKGRHTTSSRQLFIAPSGAMIIDTPGMRELQLWNASDGLSETFRDIEEIASNCRFADCRHETEPGCAVNEALSRSELDRARMENYRKMQRELDHLERKQNQGLALAERAKWKPIHKAMRNFKKG